MSNYIRPRRPGATIFFTVNLAQRDSRLLVEQISCLRAAVRATRSDRPFHVDAWVVLPNHMHCVWTLPEGDSAYSVRWGAIKARFTRLVTDAARRPGFSPAQIPSAFPVVERGRYAGLKPGLRSHKREHAIWQRRFWEHHIRDEADYAAHVRYCWINPVKHGFVARPEQWPFSSIHRDMHSGEMAAAAIRQG